MAESMQKPLAQSIFGKLRAF